MFFAQLIYTFQYFDSLLLAELYLIPHQENTNFIDSIKKALFIKPAALMTDEKQIKIQSGQNIYTKDEKTIGIYYLVEGKLQETKQNEIIIHDRGTFFGETELLLSVNRIGTVTALTDCKLIYFSNEEFLKLIEKNPKAANKAIKKLSHYTTNIY